MAKGWVKQHQVQHDELTDFMESAVVWASKNRQTALTALGAAAALIVVVGLLAYRSKSARSESWERLGVAESLAYAGRGEASLEQLQKLTAEQPGSDAAAWGQVFQGDLEYQQGKYPDAAASYLKVVERGTPKALHPVALCDLALAQEAGGKAQDAAQTAQRFLDTYPDHFLAPQAHACLARSLAAAGQAEQAKTALQKISLQYPGTSWAEWAQSKLKGS